MKEIILATKNQGKINEFLHLLRPYNIKVIPYASIVPGVDMAEYGETFAQNSIQKAESVYNMLKKPVLSDDSGLCIDAYCGYPGVRTNRCTGNLLTSDEKRNYILKIMECNENRNCSMVSSITYINEHGVITNCTRETKGVLSKTARGSNGLLYDALFIDNNPAAKGKTYGELDDDIRNKISCRHDALMNIIDSTDMIADVIREIGGNFNTKAKFVNSLGNLLSMTRERIIKAELTPDEKVIVTYKSGTTKEINVACDSFFAIIKDVVNGLPL